ncbi:MAG TPA: NAD(P)-dependent oxidoreductase, partial [Acidimicrobiia bacterium]|nr:NAD(P)-dependent oxidoreductase [Acidimicrobiia bacterium]
HEDGDLAGAFLAVAATGDAAETARVFAEAERERVLLNAVDDPARCHFAVPAVLRRGDLVVAVSTGGRAPGYAGRLRDELARAVGAEHGTLLDLVASLREELPAEWAANWRRALDHDLLGLVRAGRAGDAHALLRAALLADEHQDEYREAVA